MLLSDLQEKDIVNISDGRKIGKIIDARINSDGIIEYFIIDLKRGLRGIISTSIDTNINFNQIKKIGTDVILVEI